MILSTLLWLSEKFFTEQNAAISCLDFWQWYEPYLQATMAPAKHTLITVSNIALKFLSTKMAVM